MLLQNGVNVNVQNRFGNMPFHLAIGFNFFLSVLVSQKFGKQLAIAGLIQMLQLEKLTFIFA